MSVIIQAETQKFDDTPSHFQTYYVSSIKQIYYSKMSVKFCGLGRKYIKNAVLTCCD